MALISYDDIVKRNKKLYKSELTSALADNDKLYGSQADSANNTYDAQVGEANKAYEDSYRENAIQKLINERQVAESMANLGLTNSGLNRTQQTAVQLSYANNKANIDRQKQSQIDALELARTQSLDSIEQNRLASAASINDNWVQRVNSLASDEYKTNVEAETARLNKIEEETTKRLKQQTDNSNTRKTQKSTDISNLRTYLIDNSDDKEYAVELIKEFEEEYEDIISKTEIKTLLKAANISESDYNKLKGPGFDTSDWGREDWNSYFAKYRQQYGKAAAEVELKEFEANSWIPTNMLTYASIGARGSLGH